MALVSSRAATNGASRFDQQIDDDDVGGREKDRRAYLAAGVGEAPAFALRFFRWWGGELIRSLETLGRFVPSAFRLPNREITIVGDPGTCISGDHVTQRGTGRISALTESIGRRFAPALKAAAMPRDKVYWRQTELPFLPRDAAARVLRTRLPVETPFRLDTVLMGFRLTRRAVRPLPVNGEASSASRQGNVAVQAIVTHKDADAVLEAARSKKLSVDCLVAVMPPEIRGRDARPVILKDLAGPQALRRRRLDRILAMIVWFTCLLTSASALRLKTVAAEFEAALQAEREEISQLMNLRPGVARGDADSPGAKTATTETHVSVLETWSTLTSLLPDDVWLEALTISGRSVRIDARAKAPAAAVQMIEAHPLFENAEFSTAVTTDAEGVAQFSLVFSIVQN